MENRLLPGKRKALVIAVSEYTDPLKPLPFCKNDGEEIYEVLQKLDYQIPDNSKLVGQVKENQIRAAIYDFFGDETINSQDTMLFYYSGHGVPDSDGDMYLASSEMNPKQPYRNGFSFSELTKMMNRSASTRVVAILDCCYSGAAKVGKGSEDAAATIGTTTIEKKSQSLTQGEGKCILAACQAAQEAYGKRKGDHSIFTFYLLQGLKENEMAIDRSGNVTVDTLGTYLYDTIMSLPADQRPNQKPIRKIEAGGSIILASYPKLKQSKEAAEKSKEAAELFAEGENLNLLDEYEWNELLTAIEEKKCTPFIGPGASSRWISLNHISRKLAEEYGYPFGDSNDISKVSQYLTIDKGDELYPKRELSAELKRINPPNFALEQLRNTPHAVLADLNLPLYITTNYDKYLEEALVSRGRKPVSEFCRWNKELKDFVEYAGISSIFDKPGSKISLTEDRPLVYHLHGNIDTPESMVLTERDYIDFVVNINREEGESNLLPPVVRRAPLTTTILFIGYGIKDLNFNVIFQGVINPGASKFRQKSIAVLQPSGFTMESGFNTEKKKRALKYLDSYTKNMYKLVVYWGDAFEFAAELRKRLDEFRSKSSPLS